MPNPRDLLELVRIPGIFTAQADILAGFFIAGAAASNMPALLLLIVASSCFYAAGMALNDAFDATIDARERPGRPIPSGRIERRTAFSIGFGLLCVGLLFSLSAGWPSFLVGLLLAVAICSYDGAMKQHDWLGPANMGACRYLNLLLGLSTASLSVASFTIPLLSGVHIFGVTALSRSETQGNDSRGIVVCGISLTLVPILYCALQLGGVLPNRLGLRLCSLWAVLLMALLARLSVRPSPGNMQWTVKWLLMALVVLDGILVAGVCPWPWGALVGAMLIPAVVISKKFYIT
ncbi:UbiA family prenyltransferase [Desulfosarcina ovata]|uniref:Transferase n=1 Tax=Desulfosarcina ovata subsp. ovata TaxID=2752305 RepID=A0A5K8A5D5_9BACT|nr:UbiA family prenyltransferase [Desulfosarcina ovata]BBO87578.1 hypothetical protein DSCOOX_07580 [Desulfosarcina ovata subsp. ovata]